MTDQASIDAAYREVGTETDGLDGVVNMAGTITLGSMIEMDEATLFRVLNTNALGAFRVNRTLFPLLLKRKGRIVNIEPSIQAAFVDFGLEKKTGLKNIHPSDRAAGMAHHQPIQIRLQKASTMMGSTK